MNEVLLKGASDEIAIVTRDEQITYAELIELGNEIASFTEERSVVFLVASNTVPAIAAYTGFIRHRVVVVMLRDEMTNEQFSNLFAAYEPRYVWAPESFLKGVASDCGHLVYTNRGYELLATVFAPYEVQSETGLLLTTSGSTGTPKFVRLTYANLRANAESIAEYQHITSEDRAITTLPFSYSYGISIVNSHLISGGSLAVTESSIMSRDFWSFLKETESTNFGGVPYTYSMLERLRFERMDIPSLRFISQAGGRLGERLQALFAGICQEKSIEFFVMYGQTEATARMSWLPPSDATRKIGSIGIAIPRGQFELRDSNDSVIDEPNHSGELVYRGPNVSLGYAQCKADLANPDENQGVLHTGDVARFDEEGFFYIVGRMKRFLKMFGNRVNMDELEASISKWGYEGACVGEDDHMVVFTTNEDCDTLLNRIVDETKIHPSGFSVRHIGEIPHTASGKIDYVSLEKIGLD